MKERRVYIAAPAYDHHDDNMITTVLYRCYPPEHQDRYKNRLVHRTGQSLLANGFNCGFQDFLNHTTEPTEENGGPYDYFCLIHSDIEPAPGFLHTMIEELEANKFDVLHAVVAIKDNRGMTSTAIGQISNGWTPGRKLSMAEINRLPETFTCDDVLQFLDWRPGNCFEKLLNHPEDRWQCDLCLLPNTGVLLIKTADWCWEFPGFEIRDRMFEWYKRDEADAGRWLPPRNMADRMPYSDHYELSKARTKRKSGNVPEDWNFGRWCARKGLRVGATSKVKTKHWGKAAFGNDSDWGGEKWDHSWSGNQEVIGREPLRLDQLSAQFVRRLPNNTIRLLQENALAVGDAEGVKFSCPKCRDHDVICWFVPNVEISRGLGRVRPGCWAPMGHGINNLSLEPSVVAIEGGCGWCGRIEDGMVL